MHNGRPPLRVAAPKKPHSHPLQKEGLNMTSANSKNAIQHSHLQRFGLGLVAGHHSEALRCKAGMEKCGRHPPKAGLPPWNDGGTASTAAQAMATVSVIPKSGVFVPTGTCNKIVGGKLHRWRTEQPPIKDQPQAVEHIHHEFQGWASACGLSLFPHPQWKRPARALV